MHWSVIQRRRTRSSDPCTSIPRGKSYLCVREAWTRARMRCRTRKSSSGPYQRSLTSSKLKEHSFSMHVVVSEKRTDRVVVCGDIFCGTNLSEYSLMYEHDCRCIAMFLGLGWWRGVLTLVYCREKHTLPCPYCFVVICCFCTGMTGSLPAPMITLVATFIFVHVVCLWRN